MEDTNEKKELTEQEKEDLKKASKLEKDIKKEEGKKAKLGAEQELILKTPDGKDVDPEDYFFSTEEGIKEAKKRNLPTNYPYYFNKQCGRPVDREELIEVFHQIFDPKYKCLFYKSRDKELYIVVVPLKYAKFIGESHDSVHGDFQKHALSYVQEGSVSLDSLKLKLKRIHDNIRFGDK